MDRRARHLVLLSSLLLPAACGSGRQHTVRVLDQRLQAKLASDVAAGNAVLQPLPDGARVTLLGTSLFPNDVKALTDKYPDTRASLIEGLLDPRLMQIHITDTVTMPDEQRDARILNVDQYFAANGLQATLRPATAPPPAMAPRQAAGAPAGLTITISVQCPNRHDGPGYGNGQSKPVCD